MDSAVEGKQSLGDMVQSELDAGNEQNTVETATTEGVGSEEVDASKDEVSQKAQKHKQSANDRIRQLNEQKKEAVSKASSLEIERDAIMQETQQLKKEIAEIKELLQNNSISRADASKAISKAKSDYNESIDELDIHEDLKPFKDDIAKIAYKMAESAIAPIMQERHQEKQRQREVEKERWMSNVKESYKKVASEYRDLFDESQDGDMPVLKSQHDAEARRLAQQFAIVYEDENGQDVTYNPILSSEDGLRMLFGMIMNKNAPIRQAKDSIKRMSDAVTDTKQSKLESPESSKMPAKPSSLHDLVMKTMSELK